MALQVVPKLRKVKVAVAQPAPSAVALGVLFKEILELIPEEGAEKLIDGCLSANLRRSSAARSKSANHELRSDIDAHCFAEN